jgi:hypothetical protein
VVTAVDLVLVRLLRAAVADDWTIAEAVRTLLVAHGDDLLVLGAARARLLRRADHGGSEAVQRAVAALSVTLEIAKDERRH